MAMGFSLGKGGGHGGGHHHHGGGGRRRGGGWYGYGPGYWEDTSPSYIVIAPSSCGAGTYPASDGTCRPVPAGMIWNGAQLVPAARRSIFGMRGLGDTAADPPAAPLMAISASTAAVIGLGVIGGSATAGALLWKRHRIWGALAGGAAGVVGLLIANRAGVFVPIA